MESLGIDMPIDAEVQSGTDSPLSGKHEVAGRVIGNSFAVLPMEGLDGTTEGLPTELTTRRWQRFGRSGAKLIWGGEAVSVCPEGRGNPRQLMMREHTLPGMAGLRKALAQAHEERFSSSNDLMVGIQLTHSGRLSRPNDIAVAEPRFLYHHPLNDSRFGITPETPVMPDEEISRVIGDFVRAALQSKEAGFDFVEIKHCHGYLGHEFLSAVDRPGPYGGNFTNRTRFLREIVAGIRAKAPELAIAVRLSAFDFVPFRRSSEGVGEPVPFSGERYPYAFGGDGTGVGIDLTEPLAFLELLQELGIKLVCISAGAQYSSHLMRPSLVSAAKNYQLPEEPLAGIARLMAVTEELKRKRPDLLYVGSAYSYLQKWLPNVAQAAVRQGKVDIVGIGRMALCYPDIAADITEGRLIRNELLCRSCNDCSTCMRFGLPAGCYLRDEFYRDGEYGMQLRENKSRK